MFSNVILSWPPAHSIQTQQGAVETIIKIQFYLLTGNTLQVYSYAV